VKKLSGVLLMVLSIVLLLLGIILVFGSIASSEMGMFFVALIVLILPGVLLLIMGVKMIDAKKQPQVNPYMRGYNSTPGGPANAAGMNYNGVPNPNQPGPSPHGTMNTGFDPFDARSVNDFVQQQINQANNKNVKTVRARYVITSTTENGDLVNPFPGGTSSVAGGSPKAPVSVECPGCGAVATVPPDQAVKCEFCGAVVPYKEATT